jgi:hypothetical protein
VYRRGGTGKVVYLVDFKKNGHCDVVPDKLEIMIIEEIQNILLGTGEVVIEADDFVTCGKQVFT